jgi:HD-GYP domain-containing protein (c-di-GMP phosphodiesterase class II)
MGLAQALGWNAEQVEQAGMAGMLHDLGKLKLDLRILNKPGRLTPEEYEHVKQHARFGFEMLQQESEIDPEVAQAVLEHHERPDGRGYPHGLSGGEQQALSALITVVDAYDAITSRRPYSPPRSHHEALGILWKERGRQFSGEMVEALIQFLGWITPGTLVRLTSEQYAVVLTASHEHRLWPRVRLLEADGDHLVPAERIDLAEHNRKFPDQPIRVAEVLPAAALDIDLHRLLQQEGGPAKP